MCITCRYLFIRVSMQWNVITSSRTAIKFIEQTAQKTNRQENNQYI